MGIAFKHSPCICLSDSPLTGVQLVPETFPTGPTYVEKSAPFQRRGWGRCRFLASQRLCAGCTLWTWRAEIDILKSQKAQLQTKCKFKSIQLKGWSQPGTNSENTTEKLGCPTSPYIHLVSLFPFYHLGLGHWCVIGRSCTDDQWQTLKQSLPIVYQISSS